VKISDQCLQIDDEMVDVLDEEPVGLLHVEDVVIE